MRRTPAVPGEVRIDGAVSVFIQRGEIVVVPATPPHIYAPEISGGQPAPGKPPSRPRPKPKRKKREPGKRPDKKPSRVRIVNPVPGHRGSWGDVGPRNPHGATYPGHEGVDVMAPRGTPIRAATSGVVVKVGTDDGGNLGGNRVWIRDAEGRYWYYAHMNKTPLVKRGEMVKAGQHIGDVGNTGAPGAPTHLHIGIARRIAGTSGTNWKDWYYPYPILGDVL